MSYQLSMIFSFSIAVAAIAGWIRLKKIDPAFYPFILLVSLALLNEIVSALLIGLFHTSNSINANIYSLAEALIILNQFKKWQLFHKHNWLYLGIAIILISVWIMESIFFSSFTQFNSCFNIVYGFTIAILSIQMVNLLLISSRPLPFVKPVLLLCFCFAVFYTYSALVEVFWIWGLGGSKIFRLQIYRILYYINLITNLAYALAILWVPRKRAFLQLF